MSCAITSDGFVTTFDDFSYALSEEQSNYTVTRSGNDWVRAGFEFSDNTSSSKYGIYNME